ncbi:MAG: protein-tyrosine-phosphatase [Chloroflexi bacterium HGW-Chloroflexi-3]|nr:MAG: protein-tyrosine-phosphatase [Chloroflexi bacterium HGW-Chloroflexi-3]
MNKTRVLILCTGNSARSQMGEGLLKHLTGVRFDVLSAGTSPSTLNPYAVLAMAEIGIDIRDQYSKSLNQFLTQEFDYVITVCDHAAEVCPIFPGTAKRIHWSFPDPAAIEGDHQARLAAFVQVRDAIKVRLDQWLVELEKTEPN